jgi:very-short-patch-repair endonuclease
MSLNIRELLDQARRELLDLSTRNRLLSIPVGSKSARVIHIYDELSSEIFRLLVGEKKAFGFLPGKKPETTQESGDLISGTTQPSQDGAGDDDEIGLSPPDEDDDKNTGLAKRHVDSRLQTSLTPEGLQRRLLELYRNARTIIEETGVNILYLAIGHLKWFEADNSDTPRFAPLILVPVELFRKSAAERFYMRGREEDVEENLSLRAKLEADFEIKLPEFPDAEDLGLEAYFEAVGKSISEQSDWEVVPNAITLGFFSFAKFLMYRDLDAENWPEEKHLIEHPIVTSLMGEGFSEYKPLLAQETNLDELIPVERLDHVVDADNSQTLAIEMVREGRNLVIQGPPGTGKSQSITNIIATAVLDGKKVIFVAEKLAALEVVKRRLEREDLGDLCLELHSNKANKRAVLEEIARTWQLGKPKGSEFEALVPNLTSKRVALNQHVAILHGLHVPTGLTPFHVFGELIKLGDHGGAAAQVDLVGAESWDRMGRSEREHLLLELSERVEQIGTPMQHAWRGVQRETVLKIDLDLICNQIRKAVDKLLEVRQTAKSLSNALRSPEPPDFVSSATHILRAEHVAKAPAVDKQAICNGVWSAGLDRLGDLVETGEKFTGAVTDVGEKVTEGVWGKDFQQVRAYLAAYGESFLRFLNNNYRRAIAELRGILKIRLPRGFEARLQLTDQLVAGQAALRAVRGGKDLGESAFGSHWRAEKSDWNKLAAIIHWVKDQQAVGLGDDFRLMFADLSDTQITGQLGFQLAEQSLECQAILRRLFGELHIDLKVAFGTDDLLIIPFSQLESRLATWLADPESLSQWSNYFVRAQRARKLGLGQLVDPLEVGVIAPGGLRDCFRRACFSRILREMTKIHLELARFDGDLHDRLVAEFRRLDLDRLTLAKYQVLGAQYERMPPSNSGVGAVGILKGEMARKRGHRPIRKLLRDAGSVVQAIKPVFMMSPLSVAQFIEPGTLDFDLLVIDEASQVQPVDALGAIARCKQIVVVGDSKQLPPTRFFTRLTTEASAAEEEEDSGAAQAQDIESILGLCCARGLPQTMLRWHYRSRHHSLIAVSNHEFYENELFIVPSPYATSSELGLSFHHISEGVFDSGGSSANRIEAKAVCRAVIDHARNRPNLSLGVAAFSVRQQQAILDELELLRRENPDTEAFFNGHPAEPFFVKNLENVQGDERDVIFISIGYGRDMNGFLAMRFGPLSNDGGERRLNVLISRAKRSCDVFSSITADDIDLERASGRGVRSLKAFLQFAQTGRLAIAERSGREEQSPFEEAVRAALQQHGYEVHPQVGIAGFFIDLAVVDRERNGRYTLGIECDGAAYHSSRSARDRDRLRQAVLEDHGWIIHRIWGTDWFQRPTHQLQKTISAIERAKLAADEAFRQEKAKAKAEGSEIARENELHDDDPRFSALGQPYHIVDFKPPQNVEPHQLTAREMADLLFNIIQEEGPIHEDELVSRVKDLWNYQRAGSRIQDAVAKGIRSLLVTKRCSREDDCLSIPTAPVVVRNRETAPPGLKKPERLPPSEIRAAIFMFIDLNHGISLREIPIAVSRVFGFKTTSEVLRDVIKRQVQKLQRDGQIALENGLFQRIEPSESVTKPPA